MFILLTRKNHQALLLNLEQTWNISTEVLIPTEGRKPSEGWKLLSAELYIHGAQVQALALYYAKELTKGHGHLIILVCLPPH